MWLIVWWGSLSRMPLRRPRFSGIARLFPKFLRSIEPGIPFWPRCHAFPRSGMRVCRAHPLLCPCALNAGGTDSHACHSDVRDFPEMRVHSRTPLSLVNLAFHFGRVVMRFLEMACVGARLIPCFAHVPLTQVGLILTHATPASVIPRSCASIPDLPWV